MVLHFGLLFFENHEKNCAEGAAEGAPCAKIAKGKPQKLHVLKNAEGEKEAGGPCTPIPSGGVALAPPLTRKLRAWIFGFLPSVLKGYHSGT